MKAAIFGCAGERLTAEEKKFFREQDPFGYILFARNCIAPEQVRALTQEMREISGHRHLAILIDQEGGRVARLKPPHWRNTPAASILASLADRNLEKAKRAIYLNARLIANELASLGITVDCAPLADVPAAGSHTIIGDRAYGTEPQRVAALARVMAQGLLDGSVLPVLKHIPGHGRACVDSHEALPVVTTDRKTLEQTDFVPFQQLCDLPFGMTAHILYTALDPDKVATLSPIVIRYIREKIGFDGMLMSDDLSMKALDGDLTALAGESLRAGCDLVLHCNGDIREMQAVAEGAGKLSADAQTRAARAWQLYQPLTEFDAASAESEIASMMTAAA